MTAAGRNRADQVRDMVMAVVLLVWLLYAFAAVAQLFTTGAKVLESLPPFWFWGIPVAPYTAMYAPWRQLLPGQPPSPPPPPSPPAAPQPEVQR